MGLLDRRQSAVSQPSASAPRYGVLLVDDEIFNLTALAAQLEDDYRVHIANNANEALAVLADPKVAANIQAIISDQRMPGMSGVALLTRTRALHPGIKRLLLTGYTDVDAIVGAVNEAAVYRYLQKPVDIRELRLTLERACEAWQLEQDNQGLLAALRQSYEKLAMRDAEKTTFLRYLVHEGNTPLNWLGAVQVIDRDALNEDTLRMLQYVDQGRDRLHGLLDAVLRYFDVTGKELRLVREEVDLAAVLAQQVADLQRRHDGQVRMHLDQPATLPLVGDRNVLTEILGHLLENAVTHALRDGDAALVSVCVMTQEHDVIVEVHNSGSSPDDFTIQQLFQPFFFCGTMHGAQGFGLSLATARALALALGGDLGVPGGGGAVPIPTSTAQGGLTLRLMLPLHLPAPDALPKIVTAHTASSTP